MLVYNEIDKNYRQTRGSRRFKDIVSSLMTLHEQLPNLRVVGKINDRAMFRSARSQQAVVL